RLRPGLAGPHPAAGPHLQRAEQGEDQLDGAGRHAGQEEVTSRERMERSLADLAALVGGTVEGDGAVRIRGLASLEEAGPGELSFYGNPRYRRELGTTRASAVLIPAGEPVTRGDVAWVRVPSPHLAFARLLALFHPGPSPAPGVHPRAEVHPSARVHPTATVMALAVVEAGAAIGART